MASKKKVHAYMIFVNEWQARTGEPNFDIAVKNAAKEWDALTEDAKTQYREEAKARNAGARGRRLDILPSNEVGVSKERVSQKENLYDRQMREAMVDEWINRPLEEVINTDIYLISFNVAVKTKQGHYIPIEVGIVKFSIKEGIKDTHHEFIDGGRIPIGHGFEVKEHMERIHRIPLFDISEYPVPEMAATESHEEHVASLKNSIAAIRDFIQCERILSKLGTSKDPVYVQPVFTLPDLDGLGISQTEGCLKRMGTEVEENDFYENYGILDLTYLMFNLYRRVSDVTRPMALCTDDFFRAIHAYVSNTNCEFHDTTDTPHCALSRSYRFSYVFLDVMVPVLNIEATPAHRPKPTSPLVECELAPCEPQYQSQMNRVEREARSRGTYWSDK